MMFRSLLAIILAFSVNLTIAQPREGLIDSLKSELEKSENPVHKAQLHHKIATAYYRDLDLENAETEAIKSYKEFKKLEIDSLTSFAANLLGIIKIYQNNIDDAFSYLFEANSLAKTTGDSALVSSTFAVISNVYNQIYNQPDLAFIYVDSAELYYQPNQIKERIFSKIVKGSIFVNVSAYDKALLEYYSGIDLAKNDSSQLSSLYNNIGTVFKDIGDHKGAIKHFNLSMDYAMNDFRHLGISNYNLALLYQIDEDYEDALKYALIAIDFLKKKGIPSDLFQVKITAAHMYLELGETEESHRMFSSIDTVNIHHQELFQYHITGTIIEYPGFTYEKLDNVSNDLLKICSENLQIDVSDLLYRHFKEQGRIQRALYYKEIYSDSKDSILAKRKVINAQRVALNRIVREKNEAIILEEQRNQELSHKFELKEEKELRLRYIIVLIVLVLLSVIIFSYFLYKKNKQKLRLRQEKLDEETGRKIILLNRLDEAHIAIKAHQDEIDSLREGETGTVIKTDSAETLINNLNDRDWPNFLSEFELVYHDFFTKLEKITNSPLSKNERRLCCLIKLNLSNKEIAEYVFVSPESVKKAKNRLFKKFDISGSETSVSDEIRKI